MADGFIQLSVDSTGKKIDTRTEGTNSEHRQVMVLGDPATNAGVAPVDATKGLAVDLSATGANSNKLLVTPDLPSGASTGAKQDTGNTSVASIDTKTPALGQALAAASVPVILPSATITTLTPPAAITNFANETGGNLAAAKADLDTLAGAITAAKAQVQQNAATVPAATTMQNAAGTGNPNGTSLPVTGYATAILNIVSGTPMSGGTTVNFEASVDDTTWVSITGHQIGVVSSQATTTTTDGDWRFNVSAYKSLRARISAWSAGVTTIKGYVTPLSAHPTVVAVNAADGTNTTLGAKADAKSAATDTTPISAISILKQISASVQAPPSQAVTNTGTFAVQATMTSTTITGTVAVTESGTWTVGSSTATGSTVPANAFYNGVNAQTALPTAASAGNLTGVTADKFGRAVVLPGTIRDLVGTQTTTISASTAETTIVTAAASVFNDLTTLIISNTSATAARVDLRDTTGGSILFSLYIPAGDMRGFCPPRPLPQTSVNTNWTAQSSASVTDLRVYCVFDKNK